MKMAEIQAKREDAVQEQLNRAFNEAMSAYRKELDNMRDQELNFQKTARSGHFTVEENTPPKIVNGKVELGKVIYSWSMTKSFW